MFPKLSPTLRDAAVPMPPVNTATPMPKVAEAAESAVEIHPGGALSGLTGRAPKSTSSSAAPANPRAGLDALSTLGATGDASTVFSQATVAGEPFKVGPETPRVIREFLARTLSNNRYDSVEHLQQRAEAYFEQIGLETEIVEESREQLADPVSAVFSQAAWMGHLERGLWPANENQGDEGLALSEASRPAFTMTIRGEQGPLTQAQSRTGFESAMMGHVLAGRLNMAERVEAGVSGRHFAHRGGTHSAKTPSGMDLSADMGTVMRDAAKLFVMSGTSGSSSDAVIATRFAAGKAGLPWSAPGLSEHEARDAIVKLALRFFRSDGAGLPAERLKYRINAVRVAEGLPPKDIDAENVFTHSFSEIYSGVALTLDGAKPDDAEAMKKTVAEATVLLRAAAREKTHARDEGSA